MFVAINRKEQYVLARDAKKIVNLIVRAVMNQLYYVLVTSNSSILRILLVQNVRHSLRMKQLRIYLENYN